jgi:hypothetical protein
MAATITGRLAELARTSAFLEEARSRASIMLPEGEAGIGKTILWQAALDDARSRGFRVLACSPSSLSGAERQFHSSPVPAGPVSGYSSLTDAGIRRYFP